VNVKPIKGRHGTFYSIVHDSFIGRSLEEYGEWAQGEMHIYEKFIHKDATVVEIGSHIGSLTVPISRLCKTLFTFEPQRLLFQLLNTNLTINNIDNVYSYMYALGKENKQILLKEFDSNNISPKDGLNTGGIRLHQIETNSDGYPIKMVKLDDVIPKELKISFIKIDAETMELDIIEGAETLIKKDKPIMYVESNPFSDQSLENKIKNLGYNIYASYPDYYSPDNINKNTKRIFAPSFMSKDGTKKIYDFMLLCVPNELNFETNLIKL
jgi:FkbM family methyltransferase